MEKKTLQRIAAFGIGVYLISLITISLVFKGHALQTKWMLWGIGEVLCFFVLTAIFYPRWRDDDHRKFLNKVFWTALALRAVYAFVMCYYFYYQTGVAFEYGAGDSMWYHETGVYLSRAVKNGYISYVFKYLRAYTMGFSDQGYVLWLTLLYSIFGPSLLTPRLFKALMSAYLCIVVYRLASRTFGERTGRLAAVMCVFMPILIQMTGLHTKEAEMIFLSIYALERMDYLIRSKRYTFWNILVPILLTGLTFGFRTIIGMCLLFAFFVFIIFSPSDLVSKKVKIITISAMVVVFLAFLFTAVGSEMEIIYKRKFTDLNFQKEKYEHMGLRHGELANSLYLAPGAFVLPLSPMVNETPDHNKMIHGSTYVKNFLGFFAMLAIVMAFRHRKWRDFSLIGAYEFSYLAIIMFSFTANSERFHEPAIPLIIVMSAYAMIHLKRKHMLLFYVYCGLLFVALIGWNRLKLSAREPDSVEPLMEKLAVSHATGAGHNLPEAYQEVEYIESNGTQWINTRIPINANQTLYNDGHVRPNKLGLLICGYQNRKNRLGIRLLGKSNKIGAFWQIDGWGQPYMDVSRSESGIDVTKRLQTILNKSGFVAVQGDSTYIAYSNYKARGATGSPEISLNWSIFRSTYITDDGEEKTIISGVFYEGKIWDENDNLIAHYVPCYRKADGEVGLYDLVSGAFLGNEGESTFLKGEEVGNPSETLLLPD